MSRGAAGAVAAGGVAWLIVLLVLPLSWLAALGIALVAMLATAALVDWRRRRIAAAKARHPAGRRRPSGG